MKREKLREKSLTPEELSDLEFEIFHKTEPHGEHKEYKEFNKEKWVKLKDVLSFLDELEEEQRLKVKQILKSIDFIIKQVGDINQEKLSKTFVLAILETHKLKINKVFCESVETGGEIYGFENIYEA